MRAKLGLDKPLLGRVMRYVTDPAHGDFGNSLTTGQPVISDIADHRLPAPFELTLLGLIIAMAIACCSASSLRCARVVLSITPAASSGPPG